MHPRPTARPAAAHTAAPQRGWRARQRRGAATAAMPHASLPAPPSVPLAGPCRPGAHAAARLGRFWAQSWLDRCGTRQTKGPDRSDVALRSAVPCMHGRAAKARAAARMHVHAWSTPLRLPTPRTTAYGAGMQEKEAGSLGCLGLG
eukprot:361618-Chlamydomonas_euryale.AAC.3